MKLCKLDLQIQLHFFKMRQNEFFPMNIFLVYVNDLAYELTCPLEQYADDTKMSESHRSIEMLSAKLTENCHSLDNWMK